MALMAIRRDRHRAASNLDSGGRLLSPNRREYAADYFTDTHHRVWLWRLSRGPRLGLLRRRWHQPDSRNRSDPTSAESHLGLLASISPLAPRNQPRILICYRAISPVAPTFRRRL